MNRHSIGRCSVCRIIGVSARDAIRQRVVLTLLLPAKKAGEQTPAGIDECVALHQE